MTDRMPRAWRVAVFAGRFSMSERRRSYQEAMEVGYRLLDLVPPAALAGGGPVELRLTPEFPEDEP